MFCRIQSATHSDAAFNADRVIGIIETKRGCDIFLDDGVCIHTTATFEDVYAGICEATAVDGE